MIDRRKTLDFPSGAVSWTHFQSSTLSQPPNFPSHTRRQANLETKIAKLADIDYIANFRVLNFFPATLLAGL